MINLEDGQFRNINDIMKIIYPGSEFQDQEQEQEQEQEQAPLSEKRNLKDVQKTPLNISKNIDGNDVFIEVQAVGFEEADISVTTKMDDTGYKLVIEGTVNQEFEDDFSYTTKQFTIEPFKTVIKISREIAEGNFNIDLGAGILTIHCLPNMQATNIKKIF